MAASRSILEIAPVQIEIPVRLRKVCFALCAMNLMLCLMAYLAGVWLYDRNGLGIPTDFVQIPAAGRLALDGFAAQVFDSDILKRMEVAQLGQDFAGNFPWQYPPPFLFIASVLALLPYSVALLGWVLASILPYVAVMRAIVAHNFGVMLALAVPFVSINTLAGQNGFLTAALLGGTLVLMPTQPILSGICLGLLSYKPQYGVLFPLALIAASQWTVFFAAGVTTTALALMSWIAFGTDSWQAFFHWMPMFSQAFFTEGRATFYKLQSVFGLARTLGGSEQLAWTLQWMTSGTVGVSVVILWRSRADYALKAAALAAGTLLLTPYLFLYDMMVLAIPVGFLLRDGLAEGFRRGELGALACAMGLLVAFPFFEIPLGLGTTLIVAALIVRRAVNPSAEALPSEIAALG